LGDPRRAAERQVAGDPGDDDVVGRVVHDQRDGERDEVGDEQGAALTEREPGERGHSRADQEADAPA
jgi:hypothetical protein